MDAEKGLCPSSSAGENSTGSCGLDAENPSLAMPFLVTRKPAASVETRTIGPRNEADHSVAMLRKHYWEVVDAERYWAIRP